MLRVFVMNTLIYTLIYTLLSFHAHFPPWAVEQAGVALCSVSHNKAAVKL